MCLALLGAYQPLEKICWNEDFESLIIEGHLVKNIYPNRYSNEQNVIKWCQQHFKKDILTAIFLSQRGVSVKFNASLQHIATNNYKFPIL